MAYGFTCAEGTTWTQQAKLTAGDATAGDWFGKCVSVSDDMLAVGAFCNDSAGSNSGSAYVFTRMDAVWPQKSKLTANSVS